MVERKATFTLSEKQAVDAAMLDASRKLKGGVPLILLSGVAVLLVSALLPGLRNSMIYVVLIPLLFVLLIGLAVLQYVVLPWNARRHYRQSASLKDTITLEWDPDRFRLSGARGSVDFAWSDFYRWSENSDLLLLYHSEPLFNAVPKAVLTDAQLHDLKTMIERDIVKKH